MRELDNTSKSVLRDAATKYAEALGAKAEAEEAQKQADAKAHNAHEAVLGAASLLLNCWPSPELRMVTVMVEGRKMTVRRDANGALSLLREGDHIEL